jgi:hypothetical protein
MDTKGVAVVGLMGVLVYGSEHLEREWVKQFSLIVASNERKTVRPLCKCCAGSIDNFDGEC